MINRAAARRIIAELMTAKDVCRLAGVTKNAVLRWEKLGKISALRVGAEHGPNGGQMRLFSRSEVTCFVAERNKKRLRRELTA